LPRKKHFIIQACKPLSGKFVIPNPWHSNCKHRAYQADISKKSLNQGYSEDGDSFE
jgi:hypothetical protein